jgi:hypothetical protein
LFHLVWLRLAALPLQINLLLYTAPPEQMMAPTHAILEAQALAQLAQIVETDSRVG